MQIFSDDKTLEGISFEVKISSTVIGDTTFVDTTLITILYNKSRQKPPRFNDTDVGDDKLQFFDDDTGLQIIRPVFVSCLTDWSRTLPSIIGEADREKFLI